MLELGFNTGEAFDKEYKANDPTKYIFETVSSGFDVKIPNGIGKSQADLDRVKDKITQLDERIVPIFEKELKDRYGIDLKLVRIHDVKLIKGRWHFFYVFRNVKPMTVKEFIDYFEPEGLCYVYYPCDVVRIEEN